MAEGELEESVPFTSLLAARRGEWLVRSFDMSHITRTGIPLCHVARVPPWGSPSPSLSLRLLSCRWANPCTYLMESVCSPAALASPTIILEAVFLKGWECLCQRAGHVGKSLDLAKPYLSCV